MKVIQTKTASATPATSSMSTAGALCEALSGEARRRAWGEAGRRRFLECFTWERMVDETLRVIGGVW